MPNPKSTGQKSVGRGGSRNKENQVAKQNSKEKGLLSRIAESFARGSEEDATNRQTATEMLKDQHDEVRRLFKEYESSGEGANTTRKRLIDRASRDLEVHAQLEERIFYLACRNLEDEKARKMVGESIEEHLIVKRLIKELASLSGSDETFESKAVVLKESVEHHANEEESDLFPVAERELGKERLVELADAMRTLKERMSPAGSDPRSKPAAARKRASRA
jgi:hemerythrin-like domain-containing protein